MWFNKGDQNSLESGLKRPMGNELCRRLHPNDSRNPFSFTVAPQGVMVWGRGVPKGEDCSASRRHNSLKWSACLLRQGFSCIAYRPLDIFSKGGIHMAGTNKTYIVTYRYKNKGTSTLSSTVTAKNRLDARGKIIQRNSSHPVVILSIVER